MRIKPIHTFFILIFFSIFLFIFDLPENYRLAFTIGSFKVDRIINPPSFFGKTFPTHLGLDLSGGTHITLEADMQNVLPIDRQGALESARQVIERRVNFFGVSEPIVQAVKSAEHYRISVELPGVTNVDEAMSVIGQTAQLEFRELINVDEFIGTASAILSVENTKSVGITGKDLKRAQISFSSQTGEPEVALVFTSEGAKKFADVTRRLIGKPLAIFLDNSPLSAPIVNSEVPDGNAVITGNFTQEGASALALQLNAGALPVPVVAVEKRTIGATLGQESVVKSIRAGAIGLAIVAAFMIAKYGRLGGIAVAALVLYGLISFAFVRLIPITLTLPGIAGFILSIGMAVDSNILIFERYREELRNGKPWMIAMELGFSRAWDSIRDANFTTLITCVILFNPLNWNLLPSSGLVRGFALTLFMGVVTSLFTGIVVTRTLIRVLYREKN